jgi:hypothetical protein
VLGPIHQVVGLDVFFVRFGINYYESLNPIMVKREVIKEVQESINDSDNEVCITILIPK